MIRVSESVADNHDRYPGVPCCPVCRRALRRADGVLRCDLRHEFDRPLYVKPEADDAA